MKDIRASKNIFESSSCEIVSEGNNNTVYKEQLATKMG